VAPVPALTETGRDRARTPHPQLQPPSKVVAIAAIVIIGLILFTVPS